MKFSHSLQFNAVPDWSNHYVAYSNLKKQYVFLHVTEWGRASIGVARADEQCAV
jgi:SPX domain protein involved in polyphosphate accumulation